VQEEHLLLELPQLAERLINEMEVIDKSQTPVVDVLIREMQADVRNASRMIKDHESFITATQERLCELGAHEYRAPYEPSSPEVAPDVAEMSDDLHRLRLEQETSYPELDSLKAEWAEVVAKRRSRAPPPPADNPLHTGNPQPPRSLSKRPIDEAEVTTDPNTRRKSNHPQRPSAAAFPEWEESTNWRSSQAGAATQADPDRRGEASGAPWLTASSWRRSPSDQTLSPGIWSPNRDLGSQSQGSRQPTQDIDDSIDFLGMIEDNPLGDDTADAPQNPKKPTKPTKPKGGRGRPAKDRTVVEYRRCVAIPGQPIAPIDTLPQDVASALNTSLSDMLNVNEVASVRVTDPANHQKHVNSRLCVGQHIFSKGKGKAKTPDVADSGCTACARNSRPCVELRRGQGSEEVLFVFYPRHKDFATAEASTDLGYWL
jgi:hypothetical protein